MAISWVSRWFVNKTRTVHRPVRAKVDHGRFRPLVEALTERVMPAVAKECGGHPPREESTVDFAVG